MPPKAVPQKAALAAVCPEAAAVVELAEALHTTSARQHGEMHRGQGFRDVESTRFKGEFLQLTLQAAKTQLLRMIQFYIQMLGVQFVDADWAPQLDLMIQAAQGSMPTFSLVRAKFKTPNGEVHGFQATLRQNQDGQWVAAFQGGVLRFALAPDWAIVTITKKNILRTRSDARIVEYLPTLTLAEEQQAEQAIFAWA